LCTESIPTSFLYVRILEHNEGVLSKNAKNQPLELFLFVRFGWTHMRLTGALYKKKIFVKKVKRKY